MRVSRAALLCALLAPPAPVAQAATSRPVVITDVTIIDTGGGPAQTHRTVTVRDGRIASIEAAGAQAAKDADVVDGRGKFLIPGLWDMHVHLSWTRASAMPVMVANGVTSVRDLGGRLTEIDEWRTKAATGVLDGPRIFRAGPIINGKSFNPLQMVPGTPDETRGVVRGLKAAGVDFLKVHRRMARDSYFALLDEARKHELMVVGHIPMTVTPEEASDAGQATFEHTETLFEGTFSAALPEGGLLDAIRRFRAEGADALFARLVKNGTIVTPTLVAYGSIVATMDPARAPDPRLRYVAASLLAEAKKQPMTVTAVERGEWEKQYAELREVVRHLHRAGVVLMTGTDVAGPRIPGFPLHEELALLVDAGLTPLQALQASTTTPARHLKKTADLGTIESGKLADLVVLDADPLQDIRNTRRISAVVLAGRLLRRADLDAMLRDAESLAAAN